MVTRVALAGLAEDELAAFVAHATGAEAAAPLVAALYQRTEGNPFFVSELVRVLESGADTAEAVPGGVRDVIRHRLARLPDEVVQALSHAAVIGDEFDLDLLAAVCELDAERTLVLVEVALKERIAAEIPGAPGRFHFVHALIRETLYTELSAARRARLHQRIGDALERLDPGLVTELAHHYYEAAAPKAHAYALLAAERATATAAYEQAELQLRRALELAQHPREELAAQVQLGALLMMTRGYASAAAGEAGARASELARELGDVDQLLPALWRLGVFHEARAELGRSRAIGEQLRELGAANVRADFRLGGSQLVGVSALMCGEHALARERLTDAIALADPLGDAARVFGHDFRVTARAFLGCTLTLQDEAAAAGELLETALDLASDPFDEALARFFNAFSAVIRRDVPAARTHAEAEIALCEERGFPVFAAMARMFHGWAVGERAAIDEGLTAFEATGARMMLDCFYALLAEAHHDAGDLAAAHAAIDLGLAETEPNGRFYEAELRRLDGELLAAVGRSGDAVAMLHTAVAVAEAQGAALLEWRARASLGRVP